MHSNDVFPWCSYRVQEPAQKNAIHCMQIANGLLGVFQSVNPENGLEKKMSSGGTVSTK